MSVTATKIIYNALRDLGVLRPGQTASSDTNNDALVALNQIVDSWLLDKGMAWSARIDAYNLATGTISYTIGTGATFNGPRPTEIRAANIITSSPTARVPLEIIGVEEWARIAVQALPNGIPFKLYYDHAFDPTTGYGSIYLWPPPANTWQLELFTRQQLQTFADLTTPYILPPGYQRALEKTLAVEIAPQMSLNMKSSSFVGPQIQQANVEKIAAQAAAAVAEIQKTNAPIDIPNPAAPKG